MSIVFTLSPFLLLLVIKPCRSLWRWYNNNRKHEFFQYSLPGVDLTSIEKESKTRKVPKPSLFLHKRRGRREEEEEKVWHHLTKTTNEEGNSLWELVAEVISTSLLLDQRVHYVNIYTQEMRATVKILLPKHASKWIPSFLILYYFLPSSWFQVTA